ncbi:hypothetical protein [Acidisphaera sp. L21]|uniref:hypothetical protein n=1 Tax=Acidisphaera sp. L21 TaxID=1641851 RepID=UPI00131CE65C|nr:hypothetical protein [Acidisphaera sp. L21]
MLLSFAPTLPYYPTTFLERGVAVPFTTPMLAGTRVRPGERVTLELIVPNPSGGRGQYILPWTSLQDLCRPSLYDRTLQKGVAVLSAVTPAAIRRITRDVAAGGLAGREARASAREAVTRDTDGLIVTNFCLLMALMREVMPDDPSRGPRPPETPEVMRRRANLAVAQVAPALGLDSDGVARALEDLAAIFVGIGIGPEAMATARLPRAVTRLEKLQDDMERWIADHGDDSTGGADLVRSCAALTLSCAKATLEDARKSAQQPIELLKRWRADPEAAAIKATRPEWILDGWDHICAIWEAAQTRATQRAAIFEIAQFAPVIPREASEWVGKLDVEAEAKSLFRRLVDLNHDWRSGGNVFQQAARTEHLLAAH